MAVTQLGSGVSGGLSVTVGFDDDVPSPGLLHAVTAVTFIGQTNEINPYISSCTDSQGSGNQWFTNPGFFVPIIGLNGVRMFGGTTVPKPPFDDTWDTIMAGSAVRLVNGPGMPGTLAVGDTVTVEWAVPFDPNHERYVDGAVEIVVALIHMPYAALAAVSQSTNVYYYLGDDWPDNYQTNPTQRELNWNNDIFGNDPATADLDAMMLSMAAALGPGQPGFASFTPAAGYRVGGVNGGKTSLAVHAYDLVQKDSYVEPGGLWGGSVRAYTGNYQLCDFTGPPPTVLNNRISLDPVKFRGFDGVEE